MTLTDTMTGFRLIDWRKVAVIAQHRFEFKQVYGCWNLAHFALEQDRAAVLCLLKLSEFMPIC